MADVQPVVKIPKKLSRQPASVSELKALVFPHITFHSLQSLLQIIEKPPGHLTSISKAYLSLGERRDTLMKAHQRVSQLSNRLIASQRQHTPQELRTLVATWSSAALKEFKPLGAYLRALYADAPPSTSMSTSYTTPSELYAAGEVLDWEGESLNADDDQSKKLFTLYQTNATTEYMMALQWLGTLLPSRDVYGAKASFDPAALIAKCSINSFFGATELPSEPCVTVGTHNALRDFLVMAYAVLGTIVDDSDQLINVDRGETLLSHSQSAATIEYALRRQTNTHQELNEDGLTIVITDIPRLLLDQVDTKKDLVLLEQICQVYSRHSTFHPVCAVNSAEGSVSVRVPFHVFPQKNHFVSPAVERHSVLEVVPIFDEDTTRRTIPCFQGGQVIECTAHPRVFLDPLAREQLAFTLGVARTLGYASTRPAAVVPIASLIDLADIEEGVEGPLGEPLKGVKIVFNDAEGAIYPTALTRKERCSPAYIISSPQIEMSFPDLARPDIQSSLRNLIRQTCRFGILVIRDDEQQITPQGQEKNEAEFSKDNQPDQFQCSLVRMVNKCSSILKSLSEKKGKKRGRSFGVVISPLASDAPECSLFAGQILSPEGQELIRITFNETTKKFNITRCDRAFMQKAFDRTLEALQPPTPVGDASSIHRNFSRAGIGITRSFAEELAAPHIYPPDIIAEHFLDPTWRIVQDNVQKRILMGYSGETPEFVYAAEKFL